MRTVFIMLLFCVACLRAPTVTCEDGAICPYGYTCGANHSCLTSDQANACDGFVVGALCQADGRSGRCAEGACIFTCGDGVLDTAEQCDDGAYLNHDGCSSTCRLETAAWQQLQSPWLARAYHAAAYDTVRDRLIIFGGLAPGLANDTWAGVPTLGTLSWQKVDTQSIAPIPRFDTSMVYDPVRNVIVLFGGKDQQLNALGDTWELQGDSWVKVAPPTAPAARFNANMIYDPERQKIVLFGGQNGPIFLRDTWTYEMGAWTKLDMLATGIETSPGIDGAAAYDPLARCIVAFDGPTGNTYELSSSATLWQTILPGTNRTNVPSFRLGHSIAYLALNNQLGRVTLLGGVNSFGEVIADTWQYDAVLNVWSQIATIVTPAAANATLSSINNNTKIVLVGGETNQAPSDQIWELAATANSWKRADPNVFPVSEIRRAAVDDSGNSLLISKGVIWSFDGLRWQIVTPLGSSPPDSLVRYAIVFDATRKKLVIFGGQTSAAVQSDTWEFDVASRTFAKVTQAGVTPAGRMDATLIYDQARRVVVLYGGVEADIETKESDKTWEFNGTWRLMDTAISPGLAAGDHLGSAFAYDQVQQKSILLTSSGETWAYDGTWVKLNVPQVAPPLPNQPIRRFATMTFDPIRRRVVVIGGQNINEVLPMMLTSTGWQAIEVNGVQPAARGRASLTYVRSLRSLALTGGRKNTEKYNETWLFSFSSATPDEQCSDGIDNDGDARADNADPDCAIPYGYSNGSTEQ